MFSKPASKFILLVALSWAGGCRGPISTVNTAAKVEPSPIPGELPGVLEDFIESANHQFLVAFRPRPDPIPLNEVFQMHVQVYENSTPPRLVTNIDLAVDARMPHHRHGMNRQPVITRMRAGEFLVDNMLLHMPGYWELYFDIVRGGMAERAQTSLELE